VALQFPGSLQQADHRRRSRMAVLVTGDSSRGALPSGPNAGKG
jgi:hypothetical protein